MPQTSKQKEAQLRYRAKGRVQVNLELNLKDREEWKAYAESLGQTLPGMVRQAVRESMLAHHWESKTEETHEARQE